MTVIKKLLFRWRTRHWVRCACGEHRIAPGCRMELAGVSHGETPCYQCDGRHGL